MKIAICDDDTAFLETASQYISAFTDGGFSCFSSGKKLLEALKTTHFDCIILDIDMPEISGFEAAEEINRLYQETAVIFLTCHENLVFESFKFRPFDFVRKSRFEQEIPDVFNRLEKALLNKAPKKLQFHSGSELVSINSDEIFYIESIRNKIYVYGKSSLILSCNSTLKAAEKELPDCFCRIHSGFSVNIAHISRVSGSEITLTNNKTIPLSRSKSADFKKKFQQLIFKNGGGGCG